MPDPRANPDQSDRGVSLVPEHIDVCATCGYQAWRDGYPCNRCGGLEAVRFVPQSRDRAFSTGRLAPLVRAIQDPSGDTEPCGQCPDAVVACGDCPDTLTPDEQRRSSTGDSAT